MKNPVLLLIDIQKGFEDIDFWGSERNNLNAEQNCRKILDDFRAKNLPTIHVQHSSTNPDSKLHASNKGFEFKDEIAPLPNEKTMVKSVNSAFIGTTLLEYLKTNNIEEVIIVGLTTDHCISTTARMSGNYGFKTYIISDATATFNKKGIDGQIFNAETIHQTALASLNDEFGIVLDTNSMLKLL